MKKWIKCCPRKGGGKDTVTTLGHNDGDATALCWRVQLQWPTMDTPHYSTCLAVSNIFYKSILTTSHTTSSESYLKSMTSVIKFILQTLKFIKFKPFTIKSEWVNNLAFPTEGIFQVGCNALSSSILVSKEIKFNAF